MTVIAYKGALPVSYRGMYAGRPYLWTIEGDRWYFEGHTTSPIRGKFVTPSHMTATYRRYRKLHVRTPTGDPAYWAELRGISSPFSATSTYANFKSVSNLNNRSLSNLAERKMNLGETLAEAKGSFDTIAKRATQFYRMARALRRGDIYSAARELGIERKKAKRIKRKTARPGQSVSEAAASGYLELAFGWMPIVSDVYAATDIINNGLNKPGSNVRVVSAVSDTYTHVHKSSTFEHIVKCRCRVMHNYAFAHPSAGHTMAQLGIDNPVATLYAIQPLSFVLDWFLPIGDFLEGFTARSGLGSGDSQVLYHTVHTMKPNYSNYINGVLENKIVQRRIISPLPSLPDFQVPDQLGQAITALALIRQLS